MAQTLASALGNTTDPNAMAKVLAPGPNPAYRTATNSQTTNPYPDGNVATWGTGAGGTTYDQAQTQQQPAYVDPYAKWGGQDQYNAYLDQLHSGINSVNSGAGEAFTNLGSQLQGSAEDIFNKYFTGQQGIDTSRANNELNRMSGISDIVGYVRNGIRQGYSRLANSNAVDSSAARALTGAYSQIGNSRSRGVNNQAAIKGSEIDTSQNNLNLQRDTDVNAFHRTRDQQVAAIGADIRAKLTDLDQFAAGKALPERIAIDQEKQRLIDEGNQKIAGTDSWLQGKLGSVNPMGNDQVIAKAMELQQLGTGVANPFNTGSADQQQVEGPAIDQLPIFVSRRKLTS